MNSTAPLSFSRPVVGPAFALVLACMTLGTLGPRVSSAEEPLVLGSEHIGMTADSLDGVDENAAEPEQAAAADETPSEWASQAGGVDPWEPVEAVGAAAPAATSYEECIEIAVREGNGFSAASSVCEAIFPEPVGVEASAQTPPPDDEVAATSVEATAESEEPLVLRLHGTPPSESGGVEPAANEADEAEPVAGSDAEAEPTASEAAPADG